MGRGVANWIDLLKRVYAAFQEDRIPRLAAAFSFYAIFSIAPLLVIAVAVAGYVYGAQAAQGQIAGQIRQVVGGPAADTIQQMLASAHRPAAGLWATVLGAGTLIFGALGLFAQLQDALNTIWGVMPNPKAGLPGMVVDRLVSFLMVLATLFLLLASVGVTAAISAASRSARAPWLWQTVNSLVFLAIFTLLFATIYKVLPDAEVSWRDVLPGALITAALFTLGKYLIGLYLARAGVQSAYGAAGSLVVLLLWIYYSAQILFAGAEFTRVYVQRTGTPVRPARGAISLTAIARAEQGDDGSAECTCR